MTTVGHVDVIVVGGGVIGLATADELTQRGKSVLCFEQGAPGGGQSAGHTRTFRHFHESYEMAHRAARARGAWKTLEYRFGETLLGSEGVLIYGGGPFDVDRWSGLGVVVRRLSSGQVESLLALGRPRSAPTHEALLDVQGGAIRADRVCALLASSLGDDLRIARVLGFAAMGEGVEVRTSAGVWSCDRVIVAAGAHTAALAAAHEIEIPERRGLHLRMTFAVKAVAPPPCFIDRSGQFGEYAYGSPVAGEQALAVGLDRHEELLSLLQGDVLASSAALRDVEARILAYAGEALADVVGAPTSSRLCVFTPLGSDPDAFSAWQAGPITFVAGHNAFKFAPLIAVELADLAEGGAVPDQLRPHTDTASEPCRDRLAGCAIGQAKTATELDRSA
jgi:sarcosine oxidase